MSTLHAADKLKTLHVRKLSMAVGKEHQEFMAQVIRFFRNSLCIVKLNVTNYYNHTMSYHTELK